MPIKQLPIELQTTILRSLLSILHPPALSTYDLFRLATLEELGEPPTDSEDLQTTAAAAPHPPKPIVLRWAEHNPRLPTAFPYNAVRVCKLWRNILIRIPECWTRIVFDVAEDPTPFIDAFLWSKNTGELEVTVFTSAGDAQDVDQATENRRVSAISQALQPHIHRCKSIVFDVLYSSSLPPPTMFFLQDAPHLEELTLSCRIDDIDVRSHPSPPTAKKDRPHFVKIFPRLRKLGMPGFWFMYLALHARSSRWFRELVSEQSHVSLAISHFTFLDEGHYTFSNFVFYLCRITMVNTYYFSHLALSSPYEPPMDPEEEGGGYTLSGNFHFKNVSGDLLAHLYAITEITPNELLSFDACRIPEIRQIQFGHQLSLSNIIEDDSSSSSSSSSNGQSLLNILSVWCGSELRVRSCPSFNDILLSWLSYEVEYTRPNPDAVDPAPDNNQYHHRFIYTSKPFKTFPAETLTSLTIQDCDGFSPLALRDLVKTRNEAAKKEDEFNSQRLGEKSAVVELCVLGKVPRLEEADRVWFEANKGRVEVFWRTGGEEEQLFSVRREFQMDDDWE